MKKFIFYIVLLFVVGFSFSGYSQAEDPEKIYKMSKHEEKLDRYMKERKWKDMGIMEDEEDGTYHLYRNKSFGGGYVYIAVFPDKFVHYQKFHSDKNDYSHIMTHHDFCIVPQGKTKHNHSLHNRHTLIKNITIEDPNNHDNVNKFYGIVPENEQ